MSENAYLLKTLFQTVLALRRPSLLHHTQPAPHPLGRVTPLRVAHQRASVHAQHARWLAGQQLRTQVWLQAVRQEYKC